MRSEVVATLQAAGIRAEPDLRNEKINYKVREHSLAKVPHLLVVGKREAEEGTVALRTLGTEAPEGAGPRRADRRLRARGDRRRIFADKPARRRGHSCVATKTPSSAAARLSFGARETLGGGAESASRRNRYTSASSPGARMAPPHERPPLQ